MFNRDFLDPKMEVLWYHIIYYKGMFFARIFPYIGLIKALHMVGNSNFGF